MGFFSAWTYSEGIKAQRLQLQLSHRDPARRYVWVWWKLMGYFCWFTCSFRGLHSPPGSGPPRRAQPERTGCSNGLGLAGECSNPHTHKKKKKKLSPHILTVIISCRRTAARSQVNLTQRPRWEKVTNINLLYHFDTLGVILTKAHVLQFHKNIKT